MKASRVHAFGGPEVIQLEEVPTPEPGAGELLVDVRAAGVGPWDGWIRSGKSVLPQPLPLTLGSDLSGVVRAVGAGVTGFAPGDAVFGVTNTRFTNACAEQALASAAMMAHRPRSLDDVAAAAVPVVAVTAWQMLVERAEVRPGQTVIVHGAAGNVGACAVQLAKALGARVVATGRDGQLEALRALGADEAVRSDASIQPGRADAVLDLVGTAVHAWSFAALKRGGTLVSAVSEPDKAEAERHAVRAGFMLVRVDTASLTKLAGMIDEGKLTVRVGEVLPLADIVRAHRMLEGAEPHADGKIVLRT